MAHYMNLTMQTLSQLLVMKNTKDMIQTLFFFYSLNLKQHLEFLKFVEFMKAKGNKILWNVKTRWINVLI
jgi:hypothetical protein